MTIATALVYLLAAILFILGLLFLSSPRAARYGNWIAAGGMVLAVGWTGVVLYRSFTSAGLAICVSGVLLAMTGSVVILAVLLILVLVLGVTFVLPIGGADMPVVISLLNACTGLAVAASGFVLDNFALIVAGTLVGASGTLLTKLMSDAMGRSLANVLFGAFGQARVSAGAGAGAAGRSVRAGAPEDIGTMLAYSRSVIIV